MAPSIYTLINELEKNIIPALRENALKISSYRQKLERLANIVKFQELLKLFTVPVEAVLNENGFHISDCIYGTDKRTEGPVTCNCCHFFDKPREIFYCQGIELRSRTGFFSTSKGLFKKIIIFKLDYIRKWIELCDNIGVPHFKAFKTQEEFYQFGLNTSNYERKCCISKLAFGNRKTY
ncbi:hypothetical protein TNIN_439941 [Trichonephila inaurata madagascariensis]|uniref:Uncharacterized protein n=1 Tax=Trichonephila inaurata madagascariensis TaxID=2747483 RepID=A0A8X6IBU1_9ARAC|nr:hypothetical protein TNIN_439941 [Trichonephila inaurata madagascariensis]